MEIGGTNKMEEKLKALIKKYEGYLASDEDKYLDDVKMENIMNFLQLSRI